jgi:ADP-ribosylglycohydrolase
MRCSSAGWLAKTDAECVFLAQKTAIPTHNHPEGIKGAESTAAAIFLARTGKTKPEIKGYIETKYGYDLDRTWEYLNQRYGWKSSCQETVPEAIIAFLESDSFEDAIRKAVSIGGDSDTLACITGGIAEAFYGDIPKEMWEPTKKLFPPIFDKIIESMIMRTAYGATGEQYD